MLTTLRGWFADWLRHHREAMLVEQLLRLNDHHLADIGLRRDQLQPDGIHALDLPPQPQPRLRHPSLRHAAVRPSFQGCG